MPVASRFSLIPPSLNEEKNEGPTCRPMQNTNNINPKSCRKERMAGFPVKPKCPAKIPTNKTKVTPSEMPKILIFPKSTPPEITKA